MCLQGVPVMSYADNKCPCGAKKMTDTLICGACQHDFKDHPAMRVYMSEFEPNISKRHAAIILLSLSRKRNALMGCSR